jgi:hypothetical protein
VVEADGTNLSDCGSENSGLAEGRQPLPSRPPAPQVKRMGHGGVGGGSGGGGDGVVGGGPSNDVQPLSQNSRQQSLHRFFGR